MAQAYRDVGFQALFDQPKVASLFYLWLRKWLVGMVAGWIDDKVVNEVILVLIGRQGSYNGPSPRG